MTKFMNENIAILITALLIIFACLFFVFSILSKKHKILDKARALEKQVKSTDEIIKRYEIKLEAYNGPAGIFLIGVKAIYFFNDFTAETLELPYEKILNAQVSTPESMYLMNVNLASVLANAMTKAQIGKSVFIEYDETYRTKFIGIFGLHPKIALEIEDEILRRIYNAKNKIPM